MATLTETKTSIQALAAQHAVLLADRVTLLEGAADLARQAQDKLVSVQVVQAQLAALKAELFDGFTEALMSTPDATSYAQVGAAMDAGEV